MLSFLRVSLFSLLFLSACSSKSPLNSWQYESAKFSSSYTKHFLQDKELRASSDLRHARQFASKSANFKTLIDIELTACAMQISVLEEISCESVSDLLLLQPNSAQSAYLHLLKNSFQESDIKLLPKHYHDFARAKLNKDTSLINKTLKEIEILSSRLVSSALVKKDISIENINVLIQELSFRGYKKPLLSWLKLKIKKINDEEEKIRLRAKIKVLSTSIE
ncbi:hypothetical protein JHD50_12915 [Sulfurimonas sp. MAG313]|nr:hypothetical protein [Sulfurimonas sp. MAG313]MDF1882189.1 hypothetical protein [Sulfurimonas sp. MAG313]